MKMYKLGVIGNPIDHSLSPKIHNLFAKYLNIDIEYEAYQVLPENLNTFIKNFFKNGGDGLNITLPHKINCLNSADQLSETARQIAAANTLTYDKKTKKIYADSTDGKGLVEDLIEQVRECKGFGNILILGAGGSAQSIIPSLINEFGDSKQGTVHPIFHIYIQNRSRDKIKNIRTLYEDLATKNNVRVVDFDGFPFNYLDSNKIGVIINTRSDDYKDFSFSKISRYLVEPGFNYDLRYSKDGAMTPFTKAIKSNGLLQHRQTINGIGMLINQAALSFEIWTGKKPSERHKRLVKKRLLND